MAQPSALALGEDRSARFLPWLVGLMVFLAALSTGVAFAIDGALQRWESGLEGTLTAQLPRAAPTDDGLKLLRATPGIASATPLDGAETARLLQPWLGEAVDAGVLPLPVLVDIRVAPGAAIDVAALEVRLKAVAPGASLDHRGAWLDRLLRVARLIEIGTSLVVLLIGAVAVMAVVFTAQTGLALHAGVIDLLHLMGATDDYIARQFQSQAFRLGVRGGVIGLVVAFLSFGALRMAAEQGALAPAMNFAPGIRLPAVAWVVVLLLPLVMGLVGLVTARVTVLRSLARMP